MSTQSERESLDLCKFRAKRNMVLLQMSLHAVPLEPGNPLQPADGQRRCS